MDFLTSQRICIPTAHAARTCTHSSHATVSSVIIQVCRLGGGAHRLPHR